MAGTKGMQHYSQETKAAAIKMYLEEGYTYREISEKLEIRKARRIEAWVSQYRKDGELIFKKSSGRPRKVMDEKAYIARLEMENKLLKKLQSELQKDMLAKRDFGRSTTTRKNSK